MQSGPNEEKCACCYDKLPVWRTNVCLHNVCCDSCFLCLKQSDFFAKCPVCRTEVNVYVQAHTGEQVSTQSVLEERPAEPFDEKKYIENAERFVRRGDEDYKPEEESDSEDDDNDEDDEEDVEELANPPNAVAPPEDDEDESDELFDDGPDERVDSNLMSDA